MGYMMDTWGARINAWAHRNGFRGKNGEDKSFGDEIALMHSELSEALEAYRDHPITEIYWQWQPRKDIENIQMELRATELCFLLNHGALEIADVPDDQSVWLLYAPHGVGPELADAYIRIVETCFHYGIDLDAMVELKQTFNEGREFRNGRTRM